MSQMTSFWKAVKACWKLRVLVKMVTVTARNAHAPVGRGSKTSPASQDLFLRCGCCARLRPHKLSWQLLIDGSRHNGSSKCAQLLSSRTAMIQHL